MYLRGFRLFLVPVFLLLEYSKIINKYIYGLDFVLLDLKLLLFYI
jgi:hypothetical protein